MNRQDPQTRRLTREELSRVLRDVRGSSPSRDSSAAITVLWRRPSDHGARLRGVRCDPHPPAEPISMRDIPGLRSLKRRWVGLCLTFFVLAGGIASTQGGARAPASTSAIDVSVAERPLVAVPVSKVAEQQTTTAATRPSRGAAVEQLRLGRIAEALQSYRALAKAHANEPAFAFVAAQLERELAACRAESDTCPR